MNTNELAVSFDEPRTLNWTEELVQKFWNYQSRFPKNYFTSQYGAQIALAICKHLPSGAKILDYACGTGALTTHLLESGFTVGSCDLSPDSVDFVGRGNMGQSKFIGAFTIDRLRSIGEKFDAVVLVELVEHVDDTVLQGILHDVHNALKPDGVVIITTPNSEDLAIDTVYCPTCNHTFHRWQHVRSWSADSLKACLMRNGFQSMRFQTTDFSRSRNGGGVRRFLRSVFDFIRKRRCPHLIGFARKMG